MDPTRPPAPGPGRPSSRKGGNGGVAARRAVARWAWRLFRREWRQQVLVLGLLTLAVTAAVGGMAVAYNSVPLRDAEFGSANHIYELDGSDPAVVEADIASAEEWFGTVDVIGHSDVPIPGSVDTLDLRSQDPEGAYGRPMLAVRQGRYPTSADEVAVTDAVAETFDVDVGSSLSLRETRQTIVGIVENPADLNDEFALVSPAYAPPPETVTILLRASQERIGSFPVMAAEAGSRDRGLTERSAAAAGVLGAATVAMLLVALVAAAGFVVVAQRRLRQLGMLAAVGATQRQVRGVVVVNGAVVGVVAALAGAGLALTTWLVFGTRLETGVNHRIDRFDLPWWAIGLGVCLAVVTSIAAAWWPARSVARVPITSALSARPPHPKPTRRSAIVGSLLVILGVAGIGLGIDTTEEHLDNNDLLALGGIVALVVGVLFLCPLAIRALAACGRRAPVAIRLALRDLARYQARSGAALAAISLGLGIPAAIVVTASAAEHGADEGNLSANQLLVRLRSDPSAGQTAAGIERFEGEVDRMVAGLDDPTVVPLDVAIDPAFDPQGGRPFVALATPVDENTSRDVGIPYVATPELLAYHGLPPETIDPETDLLTGFTVELELVNTAWYLDRSGPETVTHVEPLDTSDHTSAPNSLITLDGLRRRGWEQARLGWFMDSDAPLTAGQLADARELAADAGLLVEAREQQDDLAVMRSAATAGGVLLALGILAMTVGLIRGEATGDLRTLTATGATSSVRRALTATTAGSLAFLGVLLGVTAAYLALIASYSDNLDALGQVPLTHLVVMAAVSPLSASLAGWVLAGREPPTLTRHPIE